MPFSIIKSIRPIFVHLTFIAALSTVIYLSWSSEKSLSKSPDPKMISAPQTGLSMESLTTELQIRFLLEMHTGMKALSTKAGQPARFSSSFIAPVNQLAERLIEDTLKQSSAEKVSQAYRALLFAKYIGIEPSSVNHFDQLQSINTEQFPSSFEIDRLKRIVSGESLPQSWELPPNPRISDRLATVLSTADSSEASKLRESLDSEVLHSSKRHGIFISIAAALFAIACITLFVFSWKLITGALKYRYPISSSFNPTQGLEVFTLYLLMMLGLSQVVSFLSQKQLVTNLLLANGLGITSTLLLLCWPRLFGTSFQNISGFIGLKVGSLFAIIREALVGVVSYMTAIPAMLILMIGYSIVLQNIGATPEQGAHPIVPLLLNRKDGSNVLMWSMILAVGVAPIVEEIMFRGLLFGYLRSHLGRWSSIFLSALIFAAIHPQGAIGLVPLTAIGCMLAFLREWRGTLVAPMVAHACVNGGTLLLVTSLFG